MGNTRKKMRFKLRKSQRIIQSLTGDSKKLYFFLNFCKQKPKILARKTTFREKLVHKCNSIANLEQNGRLELAYCSPGILLACNVSSPTFAKFEKKSVLNLIFKNFQQISSPSLLSAILGIIDF